jgi:ubiquinone/menaquinone biosynthesis C-methylase UbiE
MRPMRRPAFIARQSSQPTGIIGRLLARIMARETSRANDAAVRALGLQPGDRVLEIGFGHGRTVASIAAAAPGVTVDGIDLSGDMVSAATRRCSELVHEGRVRLCLGDAAQLPYADASFDKVLTVHTLYFWQEPARCLREIRRVLSDRGAFVIGFQEKTEQATRSFPAPTYRFYPAEEVGAMLQAAGFRTTAIEEVGEAGRRLLVARAEPA